MKQHFFGMSIVLSAAFTGIAYASSEGGHGGGGDKLNFIFSVINFILFLILLYVLALPRVKGFFLDRSRKVRQALQEAEKAKNLAEQKLKEYQAKLQALDKEVKEIKEAVQKEGEAEKEKIVADAQREAESIKEQARIIADQEIKKAKAELQREVARLALEKAEQVIRQQINRDDQARLINEYINNIAR